MLSHRPPSVMSSSSESSTAPMDFNVCHSLESSVQSPPLRQCQTCRQMRRSFTCVDCVRVGDISHSRALFKESFSTKKMKLSDREREKHKYAALVQERSQPHRLRDELNQYISLTEQRSETRKRIIERYKRDIDQAKADINNTKRRTNEIRDKRNSLPERKKRCIDEIHKLRNQIEDYRKRLEKVSREIIIKVRNHVQDLRTSIFPITEIRNLNPSREAEQNKQEVADLEDAVRTNYISGKWEYSNRSIDESYSIGAPCLPANGNYTILHEWVQQRQDQNPVSRDGTQEAAFEIAAGLMHLTQMVSELAFYLDLRLPYAMCFSEFSAESLTEDGLQNKIARLNGNVVFMCASQNIETTQIQPRLTVRNVLNILDNPNFPVIQSFETNSSLTQSMEETLAAHLRLFDMHAERELVGDPRAVTLDSMDDDCEWETVAAADVASSSFIDQSYADSTTSVMGRQRTTSESILSSAAAIVSTFRFSFSASTSQRHD